MKYMLLFIDDQEAFQEMDPATAGPVMEKIGEWWGKHSAAGTIFGGEQLQPPSTATTVRHKGSAEPVITDGPFMEAKEMIGGFALVDVPDLDAALDLAKTWPAKGIVEVRPLVVDTEHDHD